MSLETAFSFSEWRRIDCWLFQGYNGYFNGFFEKFMYKKEMNVIPLSVAGNAFWVAFAVAFARTWDPYLEQEIYFQVNVSFTVLRVKKIH